MLKIVERTKLWFAISIIIISVGMGFLIVKGLNLGIDFAGGTILHVDLKKFVNTEEIKGIVSNYTDDASVQTVDNTGIMIRSSALSNNQIEKIKSDIDKKYNVDPASWSTETVGPSIGKELSRNAIIALLIAGVGMLIYIAIRFEYRFGVAALLALVHDVLVTVGFYSILQIPVNSAFLAAILTIIGYSLNDTIVIFDRIRENMKTMRKSSYEEIANVSITQSMTRSINTVFNTMFTIVAIYFIGVSAVKELALPLIIGLISGSYSTIFIASPIWVLWKKHDMRKKGLAKA